MLSSGYGASAANLRVLGSAPEMSEQMKRWHRPIFLITSALAALIVVAVSTEVLLPIVLGMVIAYVLMPLVELVEKRRVPRAASILIVYIAVLGSLALFVRLTAPRIGQEVQGFARELPALSKTLRHTWIPTLQSKFRALTGETGWREDEGPGGPTEPAVIVKPRPDGSYAVDFGSGVVVRPVRNGFIVDTAAERPKPFDADQLISQSIEGSISYAQHNAVELVKLGGGIFRGVTHGFFVFGLTMMVGAYLMMTKERILSFFFSLIRPSARPDAEVLLARMDRGLSGVVRGQLIICLINGVLSAAGFALFGLKYWPILAIVATIFSLVPIFGSIASSVPAVALGLTQSWHTAALVLGWIVLIHQLEANFLNPKIMGDAAKIHPVLVVFSLLVGEHFFHITGALLAVPCMSIAQSLFLHFRQIVQRVDPELSHEPVFSSVPPPPRVPDIYIKGAGK